MTRQMTRGLGSIALVVAVAAAGLLLFASSAFAAGTLGGDTQTVAAGQEATVTFTGAAASGSGIGNWTFDVTVDAAKLGAATCTPINAAGDCNVLTGNVVRFAGAAGSDTGLTGTQTFGTITVTPTSALTTGCSDLVVSISGTGAKFQDAAGADLNPTITNGKVCIQAATNTASPAPSGSATGTPVVTPKVVPATGGPAGDSSFQLGWLAAAAGALIVVAAGAWTLARAREDS